MYKRQDLLLVREDQSGLTAGVPVVLPKASLGSYVAVSYTHLLFTAVTRVRIPYGLWCIAVKKTWKKVSKKC